jgi:hypothetical protein
MSHRFAALENMTNNVNIKKAWENIRENINISTKVSQGHELKQHKSCYDEECSKFFVKRKQINCSACRFRA